METGFDIFGKAPANIQTEAPREQKNFTKIYAPKAKDVASGIYESKIRFLYNPVDPENGSILKKVVYFLKDAEDKSHYFDSPQSIGDWNGCPIGKLWKTLKDSESAQDRKNAEQLKRRIVFYSLVYIIDDKVHPELNGTIQIFKYGVKLKAKLDRYLDAKPNKVDIFNFYTGYDFDLYLTRQGNFNDYSEAGFALQPSPISLPGFDANGDNRELLKEFMEKAPDLEEFRYRPWTDSERSRLEGILNLYRPVGSRVSTIIQDTGSHETPVQEDSSLDGIINDVETEADITNAPEASGPVTDDEDLEAFINEIGI